MKRDKVEDKSGDKAADGKKVSRIVIDFSEPGSAVIAGFQFINVSPGQMLLFSRWAELHGQLAFQQMMSAPKKQPAIIVPRAGIV